MLLKQWLVFLYVSVNVCLGMHSTALGSSLSAHMCFFLCVCVGECVCQGDFVHERRGFCVCVCDSTVNWVLFCSS